jgi:uncharacterized protein
MLCRNYCIAVVFAGIASSVPCLAAPLDARHTLKELRDLHVVKQRLDYSCGAAALATLITQYYGQNVTEQKILDLLNVEVRKLPPEALQRKKTMGFSLLDLKHAALSLGFDAAGFELPLEKLSELAAPVIVFVRPMGYHHFAVLRGIIGDRVFLADPGRGNLRMSLGRFGEEYGGIIFALGRAGEEQLVSYPLRVPRADDYVTPDANRAAYESHEGSSAAVNFVLRTRIQ